MCELHSEEPEALTVAPDQVSVLWSFLPQIKVSQPRATVVRRVTESHQRKDRWRRMGGLSSWSNGQNRQGAQCLPVPSPSASLTAVSWLHTVGEGGRQVRRHAVDYRFKWIVLHFEIFNYQWLMRLCPLIDLAGKKNPSLDGWLRERETEKKKIKRFSVNSAWSILKELIIKASETLLKVNTCHRN